MAVSFPKEWITDKWHDGIRHHFELDGHLAWIVEPEKPVGDGRWTWCMMWPEAFVERVGVPDYLKHGFYHAYIDAFSTYAAPDGMKLLVKFHEQLVKLGLNPKVNLMGLSWGGFFSLRFASENPEKVSCIYLDAPVCNLADRNPNAEGRFQQLQKAYGMSEQEMRVSFCNPINAMKPIADAGIPVFAATGETDQSVSVADNINIVEQRFKELGGKIDIRRRALWGHHPHGFDDRSELVDFMVRHAGR